MHPSAYLVALTPGILAATGLLQGGLWTWATVGFVFVLVPLLDAIWTGRSVRREQSPGPQWIGELILALTVPLNLACLGLLWWRGAVGGLSVIEWAGVVLSVGIVLGTYGLNVGHELGHRGGRAGRWAAQLLMGSALYAHFWVEHNLGHHVRVATPDDPASAEAGRWVYPFWVRSIAGGARSAWRLAPGWVGAAWGLQAAALAAVALGLGIGAALAWLGAAVVGILLLETVNYVEHYGLRRERLPDGRYERVTPRHSWNSEHPVGRALLFDLPRHADHHANPRRSCHELRYDPVSRELPAGYPSMILLALAPPLFDKAMQSALNRGNAAADG